MPKTKFYAVRAGYHPGIYTTWAECQKQTSGYGGAQFKSFPTRAEAEAFMQGSTTKPARKTPSKSGATTKSAPARHADITVYTDGGNRNTGNVQGGQVKPTDKSSWAYQIILPDETLTDTGGEWGATNNRMEVMALIQALDRLTLLDKTEADIVVITDSKYVLNPIQQNWLNGWQRRGWRRANGELVNAELWKIVYQQLKNFSHLDFQWVKGHANTDGNVLVDHLLNQTMDAMKPGQPVAEHKTVAKSTKSVSTTKVSPTESKPTSEHTEQGHLSQPGQKDQSIAAMESIVADWKNER
ncbi:ribonuclease H family protein [Lactiplantibacillus mudanjiangensis]|uniref:Ribonuclease H n=1 Tax=Lactiplantibacillus mudanjiangensis TaxID=1296538 RepID=A0A660DYI3_9LACO|nr:ribonuclease H family protein [Lactiplantibacillus mudanjiangensis]VDG24958.1 ribonuclease [Lactobacillus sp.] [Lactiplantibacillus mudanjiangensis]VDG28158.1 ribonuclease [Lactobacillus sp.] [Lactiplantibacillus mudanjiangensis]